MPGHASSFFFEVEDDVVYLLVELSEFAFHAASSAEQFVDFGCGIHLEEVEMGLRL